MNALFKKGDLVKFERNTTIQLPEVEIVGVSNPNEKETDKLPISYVIEHDLGWAPNSIRKVKFDLDETKKYLFVDEKELSLIVE